MLKNPFVRVLVLVCAAVTAVAALAASTPEPATAAPAVVAEVRAIDRYRAETWRWQTLMKRPRTPTLYTERRSRDRDYLQWVRRLWYGRAVRAERQAQNPPHRSQWLCIHRYERHPAQGWATRTGNGYYGGLQMDLAFQRAYGPELLRRKGTADNWTAAEQMWVAERAYRSGRGFYPWPNTARYCGLI
jgi:hypothetical protein